MRAWWINPAGNVYGPYDDRTALWQAVKHMPSLFGLTANDVWFSIESSDPDKLFAALDKMLAAGCIYIEFDRSNLVSFWIESYEVYAKLMPFLAEQQIPFEMTLTLRELSSMRGWQQSVQSILQGKQFSRDPNRTGTCPRCGKNISFDEIAHRQVCPQCKEKLV